MADKDPRLQREVDAPGPSDPIEGRESESAGFRDRVSAAGGRALSPGALAVALVAAAGGVVFVGRPLPLGIVGEVAGILVAAFVHGAAAGTHRYVETAIAGAAVGAGVAVIGPSLLLVGIGVPVAAVGFVGGLAAGLLGHYLGRDLRAGLTREV